MIICGLSALGGLMHEFTPTSLVAMIAFFVVLTITNYFLWLFLFVNKRRSILLTAGIVTLLFLRMIGLREPLYVVLLIAALGAIELVFQTR